MKYFLPFLLFLVLVISATTAFGQQGLIRGAILDKGNGEPLMFTNVVVSNVDPVKGTQTDLDGKYEIELMPGKYDLEVSYLGYATKKITDIDVTAAGVVVVDFLMEEAGVVLEEAVVQARAINRTENALLMLQRKASTIQDGISAQEISRYGSSNAAESMKRVTGASVVDGKYIYVRGLGDRYSAAQLNGLPLPSTDPYRNSTQLDIVPANLMENIVASKTFTPNQPGNFTGGSVNITTKSFPEEYTMSVSVSSSFNDQASFNSGFLTHDGGATDWLGYDDGSRSLPAVFDDPAVRSTLTNSLAIRARRDEETAEILDSTSKGISGQMNPFESRSSMNYGVSFSVGNQYKVFKNPLGLLLGVNYSRGLEHYSNGQFQLWELQDADAPSLALDRDLRETRSIERPQIGALMGLAYKFAGSQKITFNAMYNHNGEKDSRFLAGEFPAILSSGVFETRSLQFKERSIQNMQLIGEHVVGSKGFRIDWSGSYTSANQLEPNLRFFANSYTQRAGEEELIYGINPSEYPLPFHFFRDLQDQQWTGKVDFTLPIAQEKSKSNKIEFGALYQTKTRDFTEDRFQYQIPSTAQSYQGDPASFFAPDNVGIIGVNPANNNNISGLFITDVTTLVNSYTGTDNVAAGYAMLTYDWKKFRLITGVRAEQTNIDVISADTTKVAGNIDQLDFLPSVNLIYRLNESMNLRGAFSRTLARPNMRELAPFSSFEFIGDFLYTGNPNLDRTLIQNYDLRWEMYPKPGELIAVSAYYKKFNNPIILQFVAAAANKDEIEFANVGEAFVYGVEFEFRKSLDFISSRLKNLRFLTNVSLIQSEVDIPEDEQVNINTFNPEKGTKRTFQGQSPFLFNAALNYVNLDLGIDAIASINVFGRRLDAVSFGARPDVFEDARPQVDLSVQKTLTNRYSIKLFANNILDPEYRRTMRYKGQDFVIQSFERGRTYGVSLSYKI